MAKVVVLGINGSIGWHVANAFAQAGHAVSGFGRSNRRGQAGVEFVKGDADDVSALRRALAGADVVVNALNLPYDKWDKGRAEAQLRNVIEAMPGGGTLMFPGNVYNYAASDRRIDPGLVQRPETPRGAIRVRMEEMLKAAAAEHRFQAIILRAGDFYGPAHDGGWLVQGMLMGLSRDKLYHMADLGCRHVWAYLPDLARAFVVLGERRAELGSSENFHFCGHFVTNAQFVAAIEAAMAAPLRVRPLPWWLFQAIGLANGILRELVKMRYLWLNEMELVDPRLDALLGPGFATPFEVAVDATMADLAAPRSPAIGRPGALPAQLETEMSGAGK